MKTGKPLTLLLVFVVLLALGSVVAGSPGSHTLAPDVVASGGQAASSASYSFVSTLGQPVIAQGSSASYATCGGYWCQIPASYKVWLSVVLKNS